jgi:hypothetical protein
MTDPLESLAARAEAEPFFLAGVLAAYARGEGLDHAGLGAALGCPPGELAMLYLCRAPRPEPPEFAEDVFRIARNFGLDPNRLADAIKAGRVTLKMEAAGPGNVGRLMAARDREEGPSGADPQEVP